MASVPHDLGPVVRLDVEAIGLPGQRTFRILAANEDELAVIWIEKEQLQRLSVAVEQLLAGAEDSAGQGELPTGSPATTTTMEFQATQLGLGFDESADLFVFVAYFEDASEDAMPDFVCRSDRPGMKAFAEQIEEVVSAGRPRCPLCGVAMDGPDHVCVRTNGYHKSES